VTAAWPAARAPRPSFEPSGAPRPADRRWNPTVRRWPSRRFGHRIP